MLGQIFKVVENYLQMDWRYGLTLELGRLGAQTRKVTGSLTANLRQSPVSFFATQGLFSIIYHTTVVAFLNAIFFGLLVITVLMQRCTK